MHHTSLEEVIPGDNDGFSFNGVTVKYVKREYILVILKMIHQNKNKSFRAQVIVMNHPKSIKVGYCPVLIVILLILLKNFLNFNLRLIEELVKLLKKNQKKLKKVNLLLVLCKHKNH